MCGHFYKETMQLTDTDMNERMLEINEELSQIPHIERFDITLEDVKPRGSVKILLANRDVETSLSWVIGYSDSLEHIAHTFDDCGNMTPRTANLSPHGLDTAYFDTMGKLITEHTDGTRSEYRVKKEDREKVSLILKERLGNKFKQ
jgi:hypothetical protein